MAANYVELDIPDGAAVRAVLDDLAAAGGRGVAGVTDDGRVLALIVVADAQAASAEGTPWWAQLRRLGASDPRVDTVAEMGPFVSALPARSGFVQVIRGRVSDRASFQRVLDADAEWLARERPEVLGGALAWHELDRFTLVVCFTDESAARAGEAKNAESPGADIDRLMDDVSYDELRDPWIRPLQPPDAAAT